MDKLFSSGRGLFNDKRGVSIPIAIFVVLLLVLIVTSLFYFNTREENLNAVLDDALVLEEFNLRVAVSDYYLERVFDKATLRSGGSKEGFIMSYLEELENYKSNGVYLVNDLEQVENQISNVEVVDTGFRLELDLEVVQEYEMKIRYNYERVFVSG